MSARRARISRKGSGTKQHLRPGAPEPRFAGRAVYLAWCSGIPHEQVPGLSEIVLQPQEPLQLQK